MRKILVFILSVMMSLLAKAQHYDKKFYFPDQNLRSYFYENYPQCFDWNSDSTYQDCISLPRHLDLSGLGIYDVEGIQFTNGLNVTELDISNNYISSLKLIQSSLRYIDWLNCSKNLLKGNAEFYGDYAYLNCSYNQIGPKFDVTRAAILIANNNVIEDVYQSVSTSGKWDLRDNLIGDDYISFGDLGKKIDTLLISNNNFKGRCDRFYSYVNYVDDTCLVCKQIKIDLLSYLDMNRNETRDEGEVIDSLYFGEYIQEIPANVYQTELAREVKSTDFFRINFIQSVHTVLDSLRLYVYSMNTSYFYSPLDTSFAISCSTPKKMTILNKLKPTYPPLDANIFLEARPLYIKPNNEFIISMSFADMTYPFVKGTIELRYDHKLEIESTLTTSPVDVRTISKTDSSILFEYNRSQLVIDGHGQYVYFSIPDTFGIHVGEKIRFTATIKSYLGLFDVDSSNNTFSQEFLVASSLDPNQKSVYPNSDVTQDFITNHEDLLYTVLFQNTGNANAKKVVVVDTLSNNLDVKSLNVNSSSHPYSLNINNNVLTWTFDNINLPDSINNQQASHGFIKYRIKPRATLKVGDEIRNTANIYFDFNPAVATNTTVTKIVNPIITSISEPENLNAGLTIFPNPSKEFLNVRIDELMTNTQFELLDISGQSILKQSIKNNQTQIDISELKAGTYLYRFTTNDGVKFGKVVKQ